MKAIEQLERLKRMNELIKAESTGTPEEFSKMLRISQSHLFNLLEALKDIGAPIKYSKTRRTYLYTGTFEIKLYNSLSIIKDDKLKQIFGGCEIKLLYSNFIRANKSNLVAGF